MLTTYPRKCYQLLFLSHWFQVSSIFYKKGYILTIAFQLLLVIMCAQNKPLMRTFFQWPTQEKCCAMVTKNIQPKYSKHAQVETLVDTAPRCICPTYLITILKLLWFKFGRANKMGDALQSVGYLWLSASHIITAQMFLPDDV